MPRSRRYSPIAQALHWSVAAVLLATLVDGWVWPRLVPGQTRMSLALLHKQAGCIVLLLVVARYIVRATRRPPAAHGPVLTRFTASVVHALLYALMLLMPLSGVANLNSRNGVNFLGMQFDPTPVPFLDNWLVEPMRFWTGAHHYLGLILSWSIGLHLVAVVWHQFVRRDNLLARMLPSAGD